jgi:hypothetical protein
MPPIPSSGSRRRSRSDGLLRLGEIALRLGAEAYGQWWTIASRSWGYEVDRFVRGAMSSVPLETRLLDMAGGYVNCLGELAALAPSVAEKAAMELTRPSKASLEPYLGDEDVGLEPDGEIFEVDGKPFAMPARVLDASQGWAMYFVNTETANESLGAAREILSAFDAGGGRTPLMIVGVDYRNSDFGVYPEFVVALTVTAKGDPAGQLFTYYLAIVVTQAFTKEAAHVVWGLEKILCPKLAVRYAADNVLFGVPNTKGTALAIRFPRFGDARSSDLPTFSISQRGEGPERRTYWAMTTKSGSGEGTQIGGSVVLELGTSGGGGCLCGDGKSPCLCDMLRRFDIADRLPAANGWTERQTAVYGPPRLLDLPVQRSSVG